MRAVVGYDGSPAAAAAIEAGALLLPRLHSWVTYLWVPPFTSEPLRRRLRERIGRVDDLIAAVEREGEFEARRITATGMTLARAAGWEAEPLVEQTYGAEGAAIVRAAEKVDADVVIVGSRGLGGSAALLGSASDMVVHYSARPVLVVPHPMLSAEFGDLADGPVIVGLDGSAGAETALTAAVRLFGQRQIVAVSVDDEVHQKREDVPAAPVDTRLTHVHVEHRGHRSHGVAAAIVAEADARGAAVVVVGSRGRSAAQEVILGSVAKATLRCSHRPVLVVPDRRHELS